VGGEKRDRPFDHDSNSDLLTTDKEDRGVSKRTRRQGRTRDGIECCE
jgi:hypothetical protein